MTEYKDEMHRAFYKEPIQKVMVIYGHGEAEILDVEDQLVREMLGEAVEGEEARKRNDQKARKAFLALCHRYRFGYKT